MPQILQSWELPPQEALSLQKKLADQVVNENRLGRVTTVAGIDVGRQDDIAQAAIVVLGFPDLPAGRKPVVFTFDDSDISQFRYLEDGSIDPDSAIGILHNFHQQHPEDWPLKGTFYVLQDVNVPERILFGQKEFEDQKLQWLVEQGFEVGSHTISHFVLAAGSDEQVQWQLAVSQWQLEARLLDYDVRSLSAPFGNYPANEALLAQGIWEGESYTYASTVMVAGGPSPSPHSSEFDPYRIPRVQAIQAELDYWLDYFAQNPQFYYVSGDW